jgi:hypothetical protein
MAMPAQGSSLARRPLQHAKLYLLLLSPFCDCLADKAQCFQFNSGRVRVLLWGKEKRHANPQG